MRSNEETPLAPRRPYDEYQSARQELADVAMVVADRYRTGELELTPYLRDSLVSVADRVQQLQDWILRADVD